MILNALDQIIKLAKNRETRRIVIAAAEDEALLKAVKLATEMDIIEPILVGKKKEIIIIAEKIRFNINEMSVIDESNPFVSALKAVEVIRKGDADILMKGMVSTAPLLRAVLKKEHGLKKQGLLSHLALFQTSHYPKLLGITDAAMNISPGINEKVIIIENALEVFHALGYEKPKVAVLGPLETVNEKITSTVDAAMLAKMSDRNQIKNCVIDGPFAIDNAVSEKAAKHKGIHSEVAGHADLLLTPDLNSGNILYKTMIFLSDGISAAVILGARVPIVLTSRADDEKSKLYSIALAASIYKNNSYGI